MVGKKSLRCTTLGVVRFSLEDQVIAMPPPFLFTAISGALQTYGDPTSSNHHFIEPQQPGRKRHDSMLYNSHVAPRLLELPGSQTETMRLNASRRAQGERSERPPPPRAAPSLKQQDSFRFHVTTNPTQLKDKAEMRENRKHVMHDYLRKERFKTPGTRDIRAEGAVQVAKRRRLQSDIKNPGKSQNLAAPSIIFGPGALTPQSSCDGTARYGSENEGTMATVGSGPTSQAPREEGQSLALIPRPHRDEEDRHAACACGNNNAGHLPNSHECRWPQRDQAGSSNTPDLFSPLGFRVSPYHTWMQPTTKATVDLEKLKFKCGVRLRSSNMAKTWLPNLIRARRSFLSTLCISTAHDEAMQRMVFGSDSLRGAKKDVVYERLAVKDEVIVMINSSLNDGQQGISDATIIAVLNVLNAEMICCDVAALKTHQDGLNKMILLRRGLDKLGVFGQLARTVTVTMLANAVLQEDLADDTYLLYAEMHTTAPPSNSMLFPESPVYCGRTFGTVGQILGASESLSILELLRKMTRVFQAHGDTNVEFLKYLHDQVWSFESGMPGMEPTREDRMHEAIRLTARVCSDALVGNVHFSQASSFPTQKYPSVTRQTAEHPAAFVEIVRHLRHTDLDRVWGGLSGILFWIVLVAGAAAKRAKVKDINEAADLAIEREEEEARQWLAAVAVRCSIILGFEHGAAVLGSLRNLLDIQDRLSRRDRNQRRQNAVVGPQRDLVTGGGFCDYAREFLEVDR